MFNNLYVKMVDEFYKGGDNGWKILIHDDGDSPVIDSRNRFYYSYLAVRK